MADPAKPMVCCPKCGHVLGEAIQVNTGPGSTAVAVENTRIGPNKQLVTKCDNGSVCDNCAVNRRRKR